MQRFYPQLPLGRYFLVVQVQPPHQHLLDPTHWHTLLQPRVRSISSRRSVQNQRRLIHQRL